MLKFQHIYSSKFRISHHKPELSAQGLPIMLFMQDLIKLEGIMLIIVWKEF